MAVLGSTVTEPIGTNYSSLNGQNLTSNYFYTASTSGPYSQTLGQTSNAYSYNIMSPYTSSTLSGVITTNTSDGSITVGGNTYQVYGASTDGRLLTFGTGNVVTSNNPVYVISTTGTAPSASSYHIDSNAAFAGTACFGPGTHIRTDRGDVAVEDLRIGDRATTRAGEHRPIVWIGHRRVDITSYFKPEALFPIRFRAGSLAPNVPENDLSLSPGHRVLIDGALVQAERLVNGWSITREPRAEITYWHVELGSHDVLLAEGLPAESYLESGNRSVFENGGEVIDLRPIFDVSDDAGRCVAPVLEDGPRLAAIKTDLFRRAELFGACFTSDVGLELFADDARLTPTVVEDDRFIFTSPASDARIRLRTRADIAREVVASSEDHRRLGVFVHSLKIDGIDVGLDGAWVGQGWNEVEIHGPHLGRWTAGDVDLPSGTRIEFRIETLPVYRAFQPDASALHATASALSDGPGIDVRRGSASA